MTDKQLGIEEQARKTRRGQELTNRRDARYGSIYRRMMVWLLDDVKDTWTFTFAELASQCEMSPAQAYKVAHELKAESLIDFEKVAPHSAQYRFWLCRSNIAALAEECRQVAFKNKSGGSSKVSTTEKDFPQQRNEFSNVEAVSTTEKDFPQQRNAPYMERSLTPSTPPPTTAGEPPASWKMVEKEMLNCGIVETEKPLDKMRETGCRPETALKVIEFWIANPGRWSLGKLRRRLINLRPHQSLEDFRFWQPADVEKTSTKPNALQQMTEEEIRELAEWALTRSVNETQKAIWSTILADDNLKLGQMYGVIGKYRNALEGAIKARTQMHSEGANR